MKPRTKGATISAVATSKDFRPTRINSRGLVSKPAWKRTKMAPISATEWMVSLGPIHPRAKRAECHARQNLPQNRWQADTFKQLADHFRRHKDGEKFQQKLFGAMWHQTGG